MIKRKYIFNTLFSAFGLITLAGCSNDFLDQENPNAVSAPTFYRTPDDVALAVNGIYNSLRDGNGIGENSGLFSEERSDNTGRNDNQSNAGEPFQFNDF